MVLSIANGRFAPVIELGLDRHGWTPGAIYQGRVIVVARALSGSGSQLAIVDVAYGHVRTQPVVDEHGPVQAIAVASTPVVWSI